MSNAYRSKHKRHLLPGPERVPATVRRPELQPVRPLLPPLTRPASPARPTDLPIDSTTTVTLPRVHATAILPALRAELPDPPDAGHAFETLVDDRAWRRHLDAATAGHRRLLADLDTRMSELLAEANFTDAILGAAWDTIADKAAASEDLGQWQWAVGEMDVIDSRVKATADKAKRDRRDALNWEFARQVTGDHAVLDSVEDAVRRLAFEVGLACERAASRRRVDPPTDSVPRLTPELLAELDAQYAAGGVA